MTIHFQIEARAVARQTPLNFERVEYEAVRHRLVLFASNVPHTALPSAPDMAGPRIAIAFDLYATSDIANPVGGMPDLEYLVGL